VFEMVQQGRTVTMNLSDVPFFEGEDK
jgi:hypothetical protein